MVEGVQSWVIGRSDQLLLNKLLDPSTTSMRKGRDGEKKIVASRQPYGDRSCQQKYVLERILTKAKNTKFKTH